MARNLSQFQRKNVQNNLQNDRKVFFCCAVLFLRTASTNLLVLDWLCCDIIVLSRQLILVVILKCVPVILKLSRSSR